MKLYIKIFFAALFISIASAGSYTALVQYFARTEASQTKVKVEFFARTIDDALQRLEHLPFVISQDSLVGRALESGSGEGLNPLLKSFAERANADHIFLLDLNGKTISASNYGDSESFIGHFYTFRPYFRDALLGETGRFFAIGATTGEPGYFVSAPVRDRSGNIFGVIVVKTGLETLNQAWRDSGEQILVSNTDSVVVLASSEKNQFRTLHPLTAYARQNLESAQQFGNRQLLPLDWSIGENGRVTLDGVEYLLARARVAPEGWTLHLLTGMSGIRQQAALVIAGGLALLFGLIIGFTSFRSARLKKALGQSDKDRARLSREVEVRRAAELDLKATKDELERASRLAALGQLSASITHELGQPISAMRNYLAAEEIAADTTPNSLNPLLSGLVDRMQGINNQLKAFATPGAGEAGLFDLRGASDASVELVIHGAAAVNAEIFKRYSDQPVNVSGNQLQIEQVLVNLLRNAVDAVSAQKLREITIEVDTAGDMAFVLVTDTGTGLNNKTMANLQEPFMTTKPSGQGMGLGLAISAQIAKDMKGYIEAKDREKGGAAFTLWLPLSKDRP